MNKQVIHHPFVVLIFKQLLLYFILKILLNLYLRLLTFNTIKHSLYISNSKVDKINNFE